MQIEYAQRLCTVGYCFAIARKDARLEIHYRHCDEARRSNRKTMQIEHAQQPCTSGSFLHRKDELRIVPLIIFLELGLYYPHIKSFFYRCMVGCLNTHRNYFTGF